ncbi:hypothetical protein ONZ45_g16233 [Pleurotus djamor]|nr:hypothetical protein ONZ45_g16233 [Pleurotus djamor]
MELLSVRNYRGIGCSPTFPPSLQIVPVGLLSPYVVDPSAVRGVHGTDFDGIQMDVCLSCYKHLSVNRLPACALANGNIVGAVPQELQQLSMVEEAMIALCRTKCMIVQLREVDGVGTSSSISQKALKGNVIVYPQDTPSISKLLPPSVAEVATLITPLAVRADRIYKALLWLQRHNYLYRDIMINMAVIDELKEMDYLPLHVERTEASQSALNRTSRYDQDVDAIPPQDAVCKDMPIPFESVLITGVDPVSPPNVLRSAALRHLKDGGGNFIRIPHDQTPVNSFDNPTMFPMMFPTLFPYGIGGFDDANRLTPLSMKAQVRHMLNLFDRRYQEHHGFMFSVFNILQRRESLLRTSLRTKQISFQDIAAQLTSISLETVSKICDRLKRDERFIPENEQEKRVYKLMREVNVVNGSVCGSPSSKVQQRNEIRALMLEEGLPSFFITVNPADVYNPIVKLLAGAEIDIDNMLEAEIPKFWSQAMTVAKNPCVAAQFFNLYMKAFVRCLLGYRARGYTDDDVGGVMGRTKAYYGCVETQGRGTLHCHMLVWIEGAFSPDELKRKVISDPDFAAQVIRYLEDLIQNETPSNVDVEVASDKHHAAAVRSVDPTTPHSPMKRINDFRNVVKSSQYHKHSNTCFKYCRGSVRECRFGLGIERERPHSVISSEGEIHLRCVDGLINDYNATMLEALRCNMDIKFIGSGVSAKAALYYITDYITKLDLKSYTAYSALELAIQRLGEYDHDLDVPAIRSKKMLQKCANAMISRQELSAPIVATYLMGYEDHYTSHAFSKLYWLNFERFVDAFLGSIDQVEDADELDRTGNAESDKQVDSIDIVFDTDTEGVITPLASQVDDYVNRACGLETFCVWDMVAQLVKRPRRKSLPTSQSTKSSRVYAFLPSHQDYSTHDFHVRAVVQVPVPIGPGLPRRDRAETEERHAKVMLTLFKPWRTPSDLKSVHETWHQSYQAFLMTAARHSRDVIDNMQLLHECRDSKDDHYDAMRRIRKLSNFVDRGCVTEEDDVTLPAVANDAEVLEYLESIDTARSHTEAQKSLDVAQCMLSAVESHLVSQFSLSLSDLSSVEEPATILTSESTEAIWDGWRKAYTELDVLPSNKSVELEPLVHAPADAISIQDSRKGLFEMSKPQPTIVSLRGFQYVISTEEVMVASNPCYFNQQ